MIIAGVFIIQSVQEYHFSMVSKELREISQLVLPQLERYSDLSVSEKEAQKLISGIQDVGIRKEVYVVNKRNNKIIATTTENTGASIENILEFDLLVQAMLGQESQAVVSLQDGIDFFRTKDMAFPIFHGNKITGTLYLRSDLRDIFDTLNKSIVIIVQAIFLSSVFTILLGFFIARTITDPINDITMRVVKLAQGDFDQVVQVHSDDEIGQLAETFNYLTDRLNTSLKEISREKSKLETIIHHMEDGLIAVDRGGEIIHINPKAKDLLHISSEEMDFDHVAQKLNRTLHIDNLIKTYPTWTGTLTEKIENVYVKISFAPYENARGDKNGFVFLIQDITESQRLEAMRREFVANVSHELKTPLTSIKSYTETLLEGALDDEDTAKTFLEVVNSEADRMGRLVRDLLQLSNFDAKRVEMDFEYHDYVDLVKKSALKMDMMAKEKNQVLKVITEKRKIVGYFDYDRMEQVVLNVLSNSMKYTPEKGQIRIFLAEDDKMAKIVVEDTGSGISKKHLNRIFERFYRVDKGRSRHLGGTGLGLSIAKEIVDYHKGKINIDSKVGEGTSVKIVIPLESENTI